MAAKIKKDLNHHIGTAEINHEIVRLMITNERSGIKIVGEVIIKSLILTHCHGF